MGARIGDNSSCERFPAGHPKPNLRLLNPPSSGGGISVMGVDVHEAKAHHDIPDYNPAGTHYGGSAAVLKARWRAYAKARQAAKARSARQKRMMRYGA